MTYYLISVMAVDPDLMARIQACAAQEGAEPDPWSWAQANVLVICAQPGWADAWASALASGNETPGRDEAVITDGMILAAVQSLIGSGS